MCILCKTRPKHADDTVHQLGPDAGMPAEPMLLAAERPLLESDKPLFTQARAFGQLLQGLRAGEKLPFEPGATLTYAFATDRDSLSEASLASVGDTTVAPASAALKTMVQRAFEIWQDTVPLNFVRIDDPAEADIPIIGLLDDPEAYAAAGGPAPGDPTSIVLLSVAPGGADGSSFAADAMPRTAQQLYRSYNLSTLVHELGHVLGLDHPGPYDGSGSYEEDAVFRQDTVQYTLMSYWEAENYNGRHFPVGQPDSRSYAPTPLLYDLLAVDEIYGLRQVRTGPTTYGYGGGSNLPKWLNFTLNTQPVVAIRDSGGVDTLNLSPLKGAQTVRLAAGSFSDTHGLIGNLTIAHDTAIENALTGSGNDRIFGSALANRIEAGAGRDRLEGAGGADTLIGGLGDDTLFGQVGNDVLILGPGNDVATGGPGRDIFDFGTSQTRSRDVITDFGGDEILRLRGVDPENAELIETDFGYRLEFGQSVVVLQTQFELDDSAFRFL